MNFQIVSLLCLGLTVDFYKAKSVKIVGGDDADVRDFPYVASLRVESLNWHFCGATIISRFHLLTVAHCMYNKRYQLFDIRVWTGTSRSTTRSGCSHRVGDLHIYKEYVKPQNLHELQRKDIAIITVEEPILFDRYQRKIDLPTEDVQVGDRAEATGWGATSFPSTLPSDQMQKLYLIIEEKSNCANILRREIHEEHFCAMSRKGTGMCIGDSGGSLVSNGKLVGLMTYIIPCGKGYPDIFINVYHYLDFIKSIIGEEYTYFN